MVYHSNDDKIFKKSRAALIMKVISILILIGAVAAVAMYRDTVWNKLSKTFNFGQEGDPIPLLSLERGPLQLDVEGDGEIVGLESVPVATPNTRSGSMKIAYLIPEGTMAVPGSTLIRYDNTDMLLSLETQNNTLSSSALNDQVSSANRALTERNQATERTTAEMDYEYTMTVLPEDPTIFSQWEIINAKLNADFAKSKIDNLAAKAKVQKRINRSQDQVATIARNRARSEVEVIQQALSVMELRSTAGGLVVYRRDRRVDPKVGDTTQAGQVIIDLVDLNALQARVYVLEKEAGNLAKDKPVIIRLDAIPDKDFHGTVRSVSSLAASLERNSPLKYFTCEVTISDAGDHIRLIKPGMSLKARVILEKYDSCFMVPSSAIDYKNDQMIVYVKKGNDFEKRVVTLGYGKHGQATILKGVNENELIALRNPFEEQKLKLPDFSKASDTQQGRGGRGGMGGPGRGGGMEMMMRGGGMGGGGGYGGGGGMGGGGGGGGMMGGGGGGGGRGR
jgi:HlyD family secretion protein